MRPAVVIVAGLVVGFNLALVVPARWLVSPGSHAHEGDVWACPMMCVRLDHPGTCPVCGMALERVAGGGAVAVSEQQAALLGLATAEVRKRPVVRTVHAAGVVENRVEPTGLAARAGRALSVRVELFEQDLVWIAVGQSAAVSFDLVPGQVFGGAVANVGTAVKPETRTTTVTVEVDGRDPRILTGALATIAIEAVIDADGVRPAVSLQGRYACRLHPQVHVDAPGACPVCGLALAVDPDAEPAPDTDGRPRALAVPRDAVVLHDGRGAVYVRAADGRFARRDVELGVRAGDWITVRGGLTEGEVIAVRGAFFLDSHLELAGGGGLPERGVQRVIAWSVRHPRPVIGAFIALVVIGWVAMRGTAVDAIPDLSDDQTIVIAEWHGRPAEDVERQVTAPLSVLLRGVEGVRTVRGMSEGGMATLYVIAGDATAAGVARRRIQARLMELRGLLPEGVQPRLGPDATPLGQIYAYALAADGVNLATLRGLQDATIRPALAAVAGVAEVASVGGFEREYQVTVDPARLAAMGVDVLDLEVALRGADADAAATSVNRGGAAVSVQGLGRFHGPEDVEEVVVAMRGSAPLLVRHVAEVTLGHQVRRGTLADERGERVGGIVTMRTGENPRAVIRRVEQALAAIAPSLPPGVTVEPFYDRTRLIDETMGTLRDALVLELVVVVLVIFVFLYNVRLSAVVALSLPLGVLMAFAAMRAFGVEANLMSLTGIAIAIGTMDDMAIVMSENIFAHLQRTDDPRPRTERLIAAAREVAPAIATAAAAMIVSFLPVFFLDGRAGKLFGPLAWTKTLCVVASLVVAVVLIPVLCHLLLSGRDRPVRVDEGPVSRAIYRRYAPALRWVLDHRRRFAAACAVVLGLGVFHVVGIRPLLAPFHLAADARGGSLDDVEPFRTLEARWPPIGQAFMPPLDEGTLLYMPSLLPSASLEQTTETMIRLNRAIREVPEVARVMGKAGRAATALDPAPVSMIETVIELRPRGEWRPWIDRAALLAELRRQTELPGVTSSWLQPIEARVVMLQSDLRASMAVRLIGTPLDGAGRPMTGAAAVAAMDTLAADLERVVRDVGGVADVQALRAAGKPRLELRFDQQRAARFGANARDVLDSIELTLGSRELGAVGDGAARVPIRIAVARQRLDDVDEVVRLPVPTASIAAAAAKPQLGGHSMSAPDVRLGRGTRVPLGWLVDADEVVAPASIRTEDGLLAGYVMFNAAGGDEEAVMARALAAVRRWRLDHPDRVPAGVRFEAAGRYLDKVAADRRLALIIPAVIAINLLLLYVAFRSATLTLAVVAAIPISFAGGFLGLWLYPLVTGGDPIHLTTAVWVGFIALFGIAVDDGAVMATYLTQRFRGYQPTSVAEIRQAVLEAGERRIRPCLMTTATTIAALLPVLWGSGRGSEVMQPMAAPLVGGLAVSLITVFTVPALYAAVLERRLPRETT